MKVYVVLGDDYGEREVLLGIFSTEALAQACVDRWKAPITYTHGIPDRMIHYSGYDIEDREIDTE